MEIIGYGEDALTLWAMKNKMNVILSKLNDDSIIENCKVLFRPSFGRRGGDKSSQFGEFDFIILSDHFVYLGESKWDKSSESQEGNLLIREEQLLRHKLLKLFINEWEKAKRKDWDHFTEMVSSKLEAEGIDKPVPPKGSLLQNNLQTVLELFSDHFKSTYEVKDVLLFFYDQQKTKDIPQITNQNFSFIEIDYSSNKLDNFIRLVI